MDKKTIIMLAVLGALLPSVLIFTVAAGMIGSLAGSLGGSAAAAAGGGAAVEACYGGAGDPGGTSTGQQTGGTSGELHKKQVANAKVIDDVAVKRGLPGKATLIALMTGLVESSLINIDYGDRDSLGVFQQRPGAGWGTPAQIMDLSYSANSFFGRGPGHPPGLTDKTGWPNKPMGQVAQSVQVSAYPSRYATREQEARQIAKDAGIDVDRAGDPYAPLSGSDGGGTQISGSEDNGTTVPADLPTDCTDAGSDGTTNGGGDQYSKKGDPFTDRDGTFTKAELGRNPRTPAEAMAWARKQPEHRFQDWRSKCLNFVARAYGWAASGAKPGTNAWAYEFWQESIPANMKHPGDRHPIPGALLFWNNTGSQYGHVALYMGGGKVASTDILRPGEVDIVDVRVVENKWGAHYVGWSAPYFNWAGGTTP